jgi:Zn-dependent protease
VERLPEFLIWYAVFLFTLAFHEGAHALAAYWGGDDTAYRGGQVSLNPWPHIQREPFGTVIFPLLTFFTSGWMMGWASTPFDPRWGAAYPRRQAAMAAAGPAANLFLASISFAILRALLATGYFVAPARSSFSHMVEPSPAGAESFGYALALLLSVALNLNVLLGLFNLLPIPPLDGAGILTGLAPATFGQAVQRMTLNPAFRILGLLLAWKIFSPIARWAFSTVLGLLHPEFSYH